MKIGDVYLVEIPAINGHEQSGYRPAIVIQSTYRLEEIPTVLIIPLTSKTKAVAFPFTLTVKPDKSNNLFSTSVALIFQLRAIDKRRLKQKLGTLKNSDVNKIKQLVKKMMSLGEE